MASQRQCCQERPSLRLKSTAKFFLQAPGPVYFCRISFFMACDVMLYGNNDQVFRVEYYGIPQTTDSNAQLGSTSCLLV